MTCRRSRPRPDPVGAGADRLAPRVASGSSCVAQLIEIGDAQLRAESHGARVRLELAQDQLEQRRSCPRRWARSRPTRSPRMMRRSRSRTISVSPNRLPTPCNSATSLPERSPASTASFTLPSRSRRASRSRRNCSSRSHAPLVARAPRLDALADPDFFLRPELVELALARPPRRQLLRLAALRRPSNCPGYDRSRPRSSSTMRVATRSGTRGRASRRSPPGRRATASRAARCLDVQVIGRLVEQQQVGLERQRERQRGALALASRQLRGRCASVEAEAVQVFDESSFDTPARRVHRRHARGRRAATRLSRSVDSRAAAQVPVRPSTIAARRAC